jgi:peroxiredoxin
MPAYSKGMPVGTPAPPFTLKGVDGKTYTLGSFADAKLLVVIFTCNHCPYAQAVEERFVALARDYAAKGVALVAINSNDEKAYPEDSFAKMVERAAQRGFNFPYLRDESQSIARAFDAACTPDIFVFDGQRKLLYNGRLDDNWKEPHKVQRQDLRQVLDAALDGRGYYTGRLDFDPVPSMGCSIKWKT